MESSGASGFAPASSDPRQSLSPRQWQARVRDRVRQGQTSDQIVNELVRSGFSPQEAQGIVRQARQSHVSGGLKLLIGGLAFAFLGVVVTVGTYASASSSGGGEYLIWFGPIIAGGLLALIGLVRMLRSAS